MGTVLALDYGEARIGLAVSDVEKRHALAHSAVAAQPEETARAAIQRVIATEGVEQVVLGLPLTLAGTEGPQAARVRAFGEALREVTGLPLAYVDERFTSAEAERAAALKGTAPDAEAARLLLEGWLAR